MDSSKLVFVVVGSRPWNRQTFDNRLKTLPGTWHFISKKEELTLEFLKRCGARFVFFLHWSYIVPESILNEFECICFHMTDLPYGRGGTPLQHMILNGLKQTKLTAFRMVKELDAGPVYMKSPMSLEGTAEEIYIRAAELAADQIPKIIADQPKPVPQEGNVVLFKRRTPKESDLSVVASTDAAFDFIRMLDAKEYPRAFLEVNGLKYEFSNVRRSADGELTASVRIVQNTEATR